MAADPFASAAIRGTIGATGVGDAMDRFAKLEQALRQRGGASGIGGDAAKGYTIDIGKSDETSFGDTLKKVINQVSDTQDAAQDYMQRFINGEPVEIHQVMAKAEEAGLSLQLLVELRNKFTDAYRTVMSMQS